MLAIALVLSLRNIDTGIDSGRRSVSIWGSIALSYSNDRNSGTLGLDIDAIPVREPIVNSFCALSLSSGSIWLTIVAAPIDVREGL